MIGVSVVITNWNHELLLPRAVVSALRAIRCLRERSYDGEVLIVDDESRDGSSTLERQLEALYADDGLRVAALAANGGLRNARNAGLRLARFQYVQVLDADNELVPENLPCLLQTAIETDAAAVYGNLLLPGLVISNESMQPRIFRGNYIDAMSLVDRHQLLDVGGYSGIRGLEDWELNLHWAALGRRVVFVPVLMGMYHTLPGSLLKEAQADVPLPAIEERYKRMFNQIGLRDYLPMNTLHQRYHPAVGQL